MYFKSWLEGIEEYEPWRGLIDQHAQYKDFPFQQWFPPSQNRIYIPFQPPEEMSDAQREVAKLFADERIAITDWKNGYAQKQGDKRVYSIGRVLASLEKKDLQELEQKFKQDLMSKLKYETRVRSITKYFADIGNEFRTDPARVKQDTFFIVISADPHDLASMSTGRGWTSCMELGSGGHHEDVFCEVKTGGFIAYLIHSNDQEIRKPIARIHIRRFQNKKKNINIAVPENSVYGQEVPGFYEKVKEWIDSKQGHIVPGVYRRRGGEYSDTFGSGRKTTFAPDPQDTENIKKWLVKWMRLPEDKKSKYISYFHAALNNFFQSTFDWPRKFVQRVKDALWKKYDKYSSLFNYKARFAIKYPDLITKEDFKDLALNRSGIGDIKIKLLQAFPQYVDAELLALIGSYDRERAIKANPSLEDVNKQQIQQDILSTFNVDNFKVSPDASMYKTLGEIQDKLSLLNYFKPIPEPLIRKVVEFGNNIDKLDLLEPKQDPNNETVQYEIAKTKNNILRAILHAFFMTDSDTPTVQRFYQSMLPRWKQLGGIGEIGLYIAHLGRNAQQFLPFIKQKMQEFEKQSETPIRADLRANEEREATLENFRYVIDAIENGTGRSDQYDFTHRTMADAWEKHKFPWTK